MWSLKTVGLCWQVHFHRNVGLSARNVWSFKTNGLPSQPVASQYKFHCICMVHQDPICSCARWCHNFTLGVVTQVWLLCKDSLMCNTLTVTNTCISQHSQWCSKCCFWHLQNLENCVLMTGPKIYQLRTSKDRNTGIAVVWVQFSSHGKACPYIHWVASQQNYIANHFNQLTILFAVSKTITELEWS